MVQASGSEHEQNSAAMSSCERGEATGSGIAAESSDQNAHLRKRTDYDLGPKNDISTSTPHDTRTTTGGSASMAMARPIVSKRDPDGIHEASIRSKMFRARSIGVGTGTSVPVEIEMSSRSGSVEEEESAPAIATPHESTLPPIAPGHRRRLSSRDGSPMKIGGTLSYDESESDVGVGGGTMSAGNSPALHQQARPTLTGLAASPSYRRITFFPAVDEGDEDEEDSVDPLMEAFDFLEDEIDGHAYDDLVPLPVRLALEENVFGWSHLFSDILGHILYTAGGYSIAFWFLTWLLLRRVPDAEGGDGGCDGGMVHCAFYRRTPPDYEPIFGISFEFFVVLRGIMSTFSAINAFRTVRRRKRVWLRNDYGSAAYKSDASRRSAMIEETDRSTFLGRLRGGLGKRREGYLMRKLNKKLQRAKDRFDRRHRSRVGLMHRHGGMDTAESHHHRVKVLAQTGHIVKSTEERAREQQLFITNMPRGGHLDVIGGYAGSGPSTPADSAGSSIQAGTRWQSHTMAAAAMQSVAQDQIPFRSGEINSIPYAHGGFFGAAPFMLANPFWIDILRALMPDVYVEISRRVLTAPVPRLIHWAENNPVVAAFGTAHEMEFSGRVSTLEWDVFLDPHLVRRVEIVIEERDKFLSRCVSSRSGNHHFDITAHGTGHAEAFLDDPSEKATLQYYNAEIRRRTVILVERMLIAHGNLTQLILEQTGFAKKYNFGRIRRTRRTLGGGIYARQWLAVYAEALRLGMGYDPDGQESGVDGGYESQVTSGFSEDDLSVDDIESEFGDDDDPTSAEVATAEVEDTPLLAPANIDGTARSPPLVDRKGSLQSSGCGSHESELRRSPPPSPTTYNSFSQNDAPDIPPLETGPSADASTMASDNDATFRRRGRKLSRNMSKPSDKGGIPPRTPSTSPKKKRHRRTPSRSTTPAPASNHKSLNALAMSSVPETTIVESISLLKEITRCNAPLGLVLDIKSRHVSHRVWALVVDALRDAGARVEGIASFTISEIRDISNYCSSPCNEIYFFHSAGDVQQACYKGLLKRGDKVFFNAGSLLWHKKDVDLLDPAQVKDSMYEFLYFDCEKFKRDYCLQPYARIRPQQGGGGSVNNDGGGLGNNDEYEAERDQLLSNIGGQRSQSTIQDYRDHFGLSIGLYCQEFAIDDAAIDFIVNHVNNNGHVYNLGLSWGGVNGVTVRGIQPDRFTNTDGFWNQRYAGASWDPSLRPSSSITDGNSTGEGRRGDPVRAVGVAVGLQSFAQEQNPISSLALD